MMKQKDHRFVIKDRFFYVLCLLLLFPALLINLGNLPLVITTDEARRALVALEMMFSGNYITPTINGEFYYNKPPLYNWIIAAFFRIAGNQSELTFRLPVIISLLLFGITIFLFVRRQFGNRDAFMHAIIFVTCGRILFYDSFLGLIDITYSWIVYMSFMFIYYYYEKGKLLSLFLVSYFLTVTGFLMKGLPSLVFQGLTLLAFFIYIKRFRILFNWRHFAGIILFFLITGVYYYVYLRHNPGSVLTVVETLFTETTRRTVVRFGIWQTLGYILIFPFGLIYHFAPWTFLVFLFFRKEPVKKALNHRFIKYGLIIFFVNIIVYWTSPETRPRYLFMLIPLLFAAFYFVYKNSMNGRNPLRTTVEYLFYALIIAGFLASAAVPFMPQMQGIPGLWIKTAAVSLSMAVLVWIYYYMRERRLLILVLSLLVLRIGFNWFVIPDRIDYLEQYKNSAVEAARVSADMPLYLYKTTPMQDGISFYIERERGEILRRKHSGFTSKELYLVDGRYEDIGDHRVLYKFQLEWEETPIHLVRFQD